MPIGGGISTPTRAYEQVEDCVGTNMNQVAPSRPPSFLEQLILGQWQDWLGEGPGDAARAQSSHQVRAIYSLGKKISFFCSCCSICLEHCSPTKRQDCVGRRARLPGFKSHLYHLR